MVAISPLSNNDLKPVNLAELTQLLGTSANTGQQQNADQQTQATPSGYMFADKSRFYHQPVPASQTTQQNSQAAAAQAEDLAAAKKIFDAHLPRAFRALPDSALHLNGVAHSIELSSLYRLLLHVGWLQPIPKDGTSWPVLVQGGERVGPDYEIDGTLTVSRERYLHVETNLWFSQFKKKYDAAPPLPAVVTNLDAATRNKYPELVDAAEKGVNYVKVQSYIMRMSHRMRDDTLHYLDNPFFGVLIQVSEFNYTPPAGAQSTSPTSSP